MTLAIEIYFLTDLKLEIQHQNSADAVSGENYLPGLKLASQVLTMSSHGLSSVWAQRGPVSSPVPLPILLDQGPTFMTEFNYLLKTLFPNAVPMRTGLQHMNLGARRGGTIQSTADTKRIFTWKCRVN